MIFSIDGTQWNIGCTIERTTEVKASDISGLMMDGNYFNDVIGTYLKYDIRLESPIGRENAYNTLYEILSDPVGEHTFVMPYGSGTKSFKGRIANVRDIYVRLPNGGVHWRGTKFSVISNEPIKQRTLSEVLGG